MGNRRFVQISTIDEDNCGDPAQATKRGARNLSPSPDKNPNSQKKLGEDDEEDYKVEEEFSEEVSEEEDDEEEEEEKEEEDVVQVYAKPVGEPVKVTGKGESWRTHFEAFEYDGNQYDLEDPVLITPEGSEAVLKPYVGIIKDVIQDKDGNVIITGQWFYRPEDIDKKRCRNWLSKDERELFYSFHWEDVPAESVMHKCVVHFVPLHKQLPNRKQYPGFIVRKVYDTAKRKLWKLTEKNYKDKNQPQLDLLVQKTIERLIDLPDMEVELEEDEEEEEKVEEEEEVYTKPVGEPVKVTGQGKSLRTHFEAFEYDGNQYNLEDSVLITPEGSKAILPYVAIIKDVTQDKDGNVIMVGQWFYRPEDVEKKNCGNRISNDTRELFYSFHCDNVPAESVMHKCVVHFVPLHKQLPNGQQYPGFIVRKVYDTEKRKLRKLTHKSYKDKNQQEIDLLVQKTMERLADLPDIEEEDEEEQELEEEEEEMEEDIVKVYAKPVGEPVKVTGKGKIRRTHFEAFEYGGNQYNLEDPVLITPEGSEAVLKPYVAIIKDVAQNNDGNVIMTGQWFYRPEEVDKKSGGSRLSNDTRELFYTFHCDEVPAESIKHKCVVHFVPLHKQLPNRKQYPGFIVRKVYDTAKRKLWNLTDKNYKDKNQHEIDLLVQKTLERLIDLPDIEPQENNVTENEDLVKSKRVFRKKNIAM